jgi:cobalt-zinc-cadmium efflux system membrane fusion protein
MKKREFIGICTVVLVGLAAAIVIGLSDSKSSVSRQGHDHGGGHDQDSHGHEHDSDKGPNGGRVLKEGAFELEIVIHEKGVPPHFRVYPSNNHRPVDPKEVSVSIELERLGDKVTVFQLKPAEGFLLSEQEIDEPHSFYIKVFAEWRGEKFDWEYSQYEGRLTLEP